MEDKIRAAYDEMNPTSEQEERMLAALQAAQQDADNASDAQEAAIEKTPDSFEAKPAPQRKRTGFSVWKVVVPIAL